MSRILPARPNLEHLKNQAKDLLPELQRANPERQLADALHAIAREYGFASWPKLKAHVESCTEADRTSEENPLAGTWTADVTKSTPHPENPYRSARLQFAVEGDTVTIADVVVDTSGREERGTNTLHADGIERTHPYGYVVMARWIDRRTLEAAVTKDGGVEGRVRYEVAPDGMTLTVSTGQQTAVFDRG